jgi:sphinganine-1-phosphate aldolase
MPITAHAAFDKGCFYFGIELRKVPHKDFLTDYEEMRRQIDSNTICIVGSAPDFPYGNFDNIELLSKIALEFGIGLHVDSCLGSYVNPFVNKIEGFKTPCVFDF